MFKRIIERFILTKKFKRKYRFPCNWFQSYLEIFFFGNTQYRFLRSNLIEKPTLCTTKAAIDTLKISTIAPRSRGKVCVCNKVAIEIILKSIRSYILGTLRQYLKTPVQQ